MADRFVGIEVEPALPALVLRPAVPGDRQRLQAPVGEGDQILLQRRDAERVFDLEFGELAVRPVGLDEELAVAAKKRDLTPKCSKVASLKSPSTDFSVACSMAS